jgi:hypothetical protein
MKFEEIEKDFKLYLESAGADQFKKDIMEKSFIEVKPNDLYYDGQFYEFSDSHHSDDISVDPEDQTRRIVRYIYHETMAEATILTLMMEHLGPDSSAFLSRIHGAWFKKKQEESAQNEKA